MAEGKGFKCPEYLELLLYIVMPRRLKQNNNGNLEFTEFVWDDDEDNVTHPLTEIVELYQRNDNILPNAQRRPNWLSATVNELGVNSQLERWEEEVNVKITNPDNNLSVGTYTFRFRASDGKEETDHTVELEVS